MRTEKLAREEKLLRKIYITRGVVGESRCNKLISIWFRRRPTKFISLLTQQQRQIWDKTEKKLELIKHRKNLIIGTREFLTLTQAKQAPIARERRHQRRAQKWVVFLLRDSNSFSLKGKEKKRGKSRNRADKMLKIIQFSWIWIAFKWRPENRNTLPYSHTRCLLFIQRNKLIFNRFSVALCVCVLWPFSWSRSFILALKRNP